VKTLDYTSDFLGTTQYRHVVFRLRDFLEYQSSKKDSISDYQVQQARQFFVKLQQNSLIRIFPDSEFRSLVSIPKLKFEKSNKNAWIIKIWMAEELFFYLSPFLLPNLFEQKVTEDDLEVQNHILQVFTSQSLEKKFLIQEFLTSYSAVLSNPQKTKIKKLFLQLVNSLEKHNLIESNYKVLSNGFYHPVERLTIQNISEGFILYQKLSRYPF
jgi:hypothetical protein